LAHSLSAIGKAAAATTTGVPQVGGPFQTGPLQPMSLQPPPPEADPNAPDPAAIAKEQARMEIEQGKQQAAAKAEQDKTLAEVRETQLATQHDSELRAKDMEHQQALASIEVEKEKELAKSQLEMEKVKMQAQVAEDQAKRTEQQARKALSQAQAQAQKAQQQEIKSQQQVQQVQMDAQQKGMQAEMRAQQTAQEAQMQAQQESQMSAQQAQHQVLQGKQEAQMSAQQAQQESAMQTQQAKQEAAAATQAAKQQPAAQAPGAAAGQPNVNPEQQAGGGNEGLLRKRLAESFQAGPKGVPAEQAVKMAGLPVSRKPGAAATLKRLDSFTDNQVAKENPLGPKYYGSPADIPSGLGPAAKPFVRSRTEPGTSANGWVSQPVKRQLQPEDKALRAQFPGIYNSKAYNQPGVQNLKNFAFGWTPLAGSRIISNAADGNWGQAAFNAAATLPLGGAARKVTGFAGNMLRKIPPPAAMLRDPKVQAVLAGKGLGAGAFAATLPRRGTPVSTLAETETKYLSPAEQARARVERLALPDMAGQPAPEGENPLTQEELDMASSLPGWQDLVDKQRVAADVYNTGSPFGKSGVDANPVTRDSARMYTPGAPKSWEKMDWGADWANKGWQSIGMPVYQMFTQKPQQDMTPPGGLTGPNQSWAELNLGKRGPEIAQGVPPPWWSGPLNSLLGGQGLGAAASRMANDPYLINRAQGFLGAQTPFAGQA
jgi:hypothetical protein